MKTLPASVGLGRRRASALAEDCAFRARVLPRPLALHRNVHRSALISCLGCSRSFRSDNWAEMILRVQYESLLRLSKHTLVFIDTENDASCRRLKNNTQALSRGSGDSSVDPGLYIHPWVSPPFSELQYETDGVCNCQSLGHHLTA